MARGSTGPLASILIISLNIFVYDFVRRRGACIFSIFLQFLTFKMFYLVELNRCCVFVLH